MLAKLIVWGRDRDEAIDRWATAAADSRSAGCARRCPSRRSLARDADFRAGRFHTEWLSPWVQANRPARLSDREAEAVAIAAALRAARLGGGAPAAAAAAAAPGASPVSPWVLLGRRDALGS